MENNIKVERKCYTRRIILYMIYNVKFARFYRFFHYMTYAKNLHEYIRFKEEVDEFDNTQLGTYVRT